MPPGRCGRQPARNMWRRNRRSSSLADQTECDRQGASRDLRTSDSIDGKFTPRDDRRSASGTVNCCALVYLGLHRMQASRSNGRGGEPHEVRAPAKATSASRRCQASTGDLNACPRLRRAAGCPVRSNTAGPSQIVRDRGFTSLSGALNKAAMFDDLHFKFTKVAGEEIVAFDFLASVQQHHKIAKAIRQHVHNWLIQALGVVTEPRPFAQAAMRAQNRDKLAEMVSGLGKGTT